MMEKLLVSACLLGCRCRYDGGDCADERVLALRDTYELIPVCPEQMGGLPTPRLPSEIREGRVYMKDGTDVTAAFASGAAAALYIAKTLGSTKAVLKAKSPSCGKGLVYDGTFTGGKVPGDGVTAALLKKNGVSVYTEEETDMLLTDEIY